MVNVTALAQACGVSRTAVLYYESAGLRRRLVEIDAEIARLLPGAGALRRRDMITKDMWVRIMKKAGLSEDDMHRWHREFEASAPAEHQEFLEFLHIPPDEIRSIRGWSRKPQGDS